MNLLIDLGCHSIYCFGECFHGLLDLIEIIICQRFFHSRSALFNLCFVFWFELVPTIFEHLLGSKDCGVGLVVQLDLIAFLFVFALKYFCGVHHLLDVFIREFFVAFDGDVLLVAGAKVLCGDVDDTIRIDIKRDFNLWNTARSRGNSGQLEFAECEVVFCKRTFTLDYMDLNTCLAISSS